VEILSRALPAGPRCSTNEGDGLRWPAGQSGNRGGTWASENERQQPRRKLTRRGPWGGTCGAKAYNRCIPAEGWRGLAGQARGLMSPSSKLARPAWNSRRKFTEIRSFQDFVGKGQKPAKIQEGAGGGAHFAGAAGSAKTQQATAGSSCHHISAEPTTWFPSGFGGWPPTSSFTRKKPRYLSAVRDEFQRFQRPIPDGSAPSVNLARGGGGKKRRLGGLRRFRAPQRGGGREGRLPQARSFPGRRGFWNFRLLGAGFRHKLARGASTGQATICALKSGQCWRVGRKGAAFEAWREGRKGTGCGDEMIAYSGEDEKA